MPSRNGLYGRVPPASGQDDGQITVKRSWSPSGQARNHVLTWPFEWSYGDSNSGPLACHADPVCRSTSEGVERGATHLQQQSEWVAGSLGVPEHAGSRFWLPCPLRMEKAPMASEFQELSVSAEADGSVKPTAIWAGATQTVLET